MTRLGLPPCRYGLSPLSRLAVTLSLAAGLAAGAYLWSAI